MESDLITDALGPLESNYGTRIWSLLLAPDRIIAWPYDVHESFQFALRRQLLYWPGDPGAAIRSLARAGMRESSLPRSRDARRYQVHWLRSIVIRSGRTADTITFKKLSGETDEYAIILRPETNEYQAVLSKHYPDQYQEKDFPPAQLAA